jgi:predicted nucleic acid-binding Zn ribbon protein|tara:strand:- start:457 stop:912 length:456 start_codon:yes stop_codon:yes gene_type:complete
MMSKRDLALELFRSYKTGFIKKTKPVQERTSTPGDPTLINEVMSDLISQRDWHLGIAEGTLFSKWKEVVGADIASHTTPLSLLEGALLIQCSSTAWATQLTAVGQDLLNTVKNSSPGAGVQSLTFIGPQPPSWKRGLRTIKNERGPRDTYG